MLFLSQHRWFSHLVWIVILNLPASIAWSKGTQHPLPDQAPPPPKGILDFKPDAQKKMETLNTTTSQNEGFRRVEDSFRNIEVGKNRAKEMVLMLRSDELTEAFSKITERTSKNITENPALATPLAIIGGAASFWYGRSLKVFENDVFKFGARIEGQNRRSEFTMNSPLMNGKLDFNDQRGMNMGFGRQISSINANAYLNYNFRDQTVNTEYRQKLSPNLDLTFGVGKTDQNTRIEYRFNF